jgi:hypothetical protein
MPYRTPTERYDRTLPLITKARDDVRRAIAEAHPVEGCLPILPIDVPASAEVVREAVYAMCESLWTHNGSHRHPEWVAARTACTHVPEEQVLNVFELLVEWYRALSKVHCYVNKVPFWADWRAVEGRHALDRELRIVAAFPEVMASQGAGLDARGLAKLSRQLRVKVYAEIRPS